VVCHRRLRIDRSQAARHTAPAQLAVACDLDLARPESLAKGADTGARVRDIASDAINDPAVDAVIVSTLNNSLADITAAHYGRENPCWRRSRRIRGTSRCAKGVVGPVPSPQLNTPPSVATLTGLET
jgi:hypothetical protein